jgi:hypothetical protein
MMTSRHALLAAVGLTVVALLATLALWPPAAGARAMPLQPAKSTKAFADSVGVNVHLTYLDTAYGDYASLKPRLLALGARWIRDGLCAGCILQHRRLNDLAAAGIRAQLIMGTPRYRSTAPTLMRVAETRVPRAVGAVEGSNEWDLTGRETWVSEVKFHQSELYRRVKASPTLRRVPVVGPSVARRGSRETLGDISGMLDQGNFHPYAGGLKPGWNLPAELGFSALNSAGKPVVATEIGYHNAVGTTTTHPGVSERASSIYIPRMYLDAFSRGIPRSFAYELVSPWEDPSGDTRDRQFGFLRHDYVEKPAYRSLQTLLRVLGDTTIAGAADGLRYALSGDTTDVRSLLLRGADGTAYLALWRDVSVWDRDAKRDLSPAARRVRVTLGQRVGRAEVFDVLRGTGAVARSTAPERVDLGVPAQPVVLKLTPSARP